jgi:flagellar assembly protein FliH
MTSIKRYLFEDRSFDPDYDPFDENSSEFEGDENGYEEDDVEEEVEEPPAPTFSEEEVASAQQTAFDEGKAAGLQEAQELFENMIAGALTQISQTIPVVFEEHSKSQEEHEAHALAIATSVSKKIIPAYAESNGLDEIISVVSKCLEPLRSEPRLIVKVHETLREDVHEKLTKVADQIGFDGRVVVMAHEELIPGDCRVEWSEGGAERNIEDLWKQIDEIIERNLTQGANQSDTQEESIAQEVPAPSQDGETAG